MSSSNSTSLDELPNSPELANNVVQQQTINPQQVENIKIQNYGEELVKEQSGQQVTQAPPIDFTQQLTSQLALARESGATVLPSRDIPINTLSNQNDPSIKPDFIPNKASEDYIGNIIDHQKTLINRNKNQEKSQNLEILYNQIQIPVLVGILFFLFQLPIIRQYLFKVLPSLYSKDGNPNLFGYVLNSALFGILFFLMVKGLEYVQDNI